MILLMSVPVSGFMSAHAKCLLCVTEIYSVVVIRSYEKGVRLEVGHWARYVEKCMLMRCMNCMIDITRCPVRHEVI